MHSTRAAESFSAAKFCANKPHHIAQRPEQGHISIGGNGGELAINGQRVQRHNGTRTLMNEKSMSHRR